MPANKSHILPAIPNGTTGQDLVDAVNDRLRRIGLTAAAAPAPPAITAPVRPVVPPGGGAGDDSVTFNSVPVTHGSVSAHQATSDFKGEHVSVKMFGAKGDGVHDDTAAIQAALDWAKTHMDVIGVEEVSLFFPRAQAFYKVTATLNLFSHLELIGYRAKIIYSGTGALFSIPLSVSGSIHGFVLQGNETADQWAIKIVGTGTPPNGALLQWIYDNRFYKFGDPATNSGGAIWNAADSGKMIIGPHNFFAVDGTGFLSAAPTDSLNIHDNYFGGLGRAMDFAGETGAAQVTISYNNIVNMSGAFRKKGPGTYVILGNEYEPGGTGPINNASSAIWEFLDDGTGTPGIVKFLYNFTAMRNQCAYGFYDAGTSIFSDFDFNSFAGAAPVDPLQFGMYNPNPSQTNRYGTNNRMYQPTANLYKFPDDPGIRIWPLSSVSLTDAMTLLRASPNASPTLDDLSSGGTFTGTGDHTYTVRISRIGLPGPSGAIGADQFDWNVDGNPWQPSQLITGASQPLTAGITLTFGAVNGHLLGTMWHIVVTGGVIGPASLFATIFMQHGDFQFFPTSVGNTLNRAPGGFGRWQWSVQNSTATDASSFGETGSGVSSPSWLTTGSTFLLFPLALFLGTTGGTLAHLVLGTLSGVPYIEIPALAGGGSRYLTVDNTGVVGATLTGAGGPPTGAAGGALGGTYPNPTLTAVQQVATSVLSLTTSYVDVPGASLTSLAAGVWLVMGVFDFICASPDGQVTGALNVGGTLQTAVAAANNASTSSAETTDSQTWLITLGAPTTVKLQAKKAGASGLGSCNNGNTTITALKIG